jgi:DNA-directed RNA polymerase subunit M
MLYPQKGGGMQCNKCGYSPGKVKSSKLSQDVQVKETVILETPHESAEPRMKAECSKCGNLEANWILRQTRRSDEPETRILTCTKCKHRWREY